jgi:AraC-like DNA-binding protein
VEHLRKWLGNTLVPQPGPMLTIDLDDDMLDAPLPFDAAVAHDPAKPLAHNWGSLSGDASFGHSVRLVISAMANAPPVTVARVAHAAGMSDRTLQRTLRGEGASFRRLVDAVRCDRALRMLPTRADPLALLAHDAGYAAQSSLSRAVRRWTGQPPRAVRAASARNKPSA